MEGNQVHVARAQGKSFDQKLSAGRSFSLGDGSENYGSSANHDLYIPDRDPYIPSNLKT